MVDTLYHSYAEHQPLSEVYGPICNNIHGVLALKCAAVFICRPYQYNQQTCQTLFSRT